LRTKLSELTVDAGKCLEDGAGEGAAALAEALAARRPANALVKVNVPHPAQLLACAQVLLDVLQESVPQKRQKMR
jgi:hypothetical protein